LTFSLAAIFGFKAAYLSEDILSANGVEIPITVAKDTQ
jgi:hypothetical protein